MMGVAEQATADEFLAASRTAQQAGAFDGMLQAATRAHECAPSDSEIGLRLAECQLLCGRVQDAIAELHTLETQAGRDHLLLQRVAEQYTQCSRFDDADRCHRKSASLRPDDPRYLYNLAASGIALGDLDEAERLLTEVIRLDPRDYDAWQKPLHLRHQTREQNHVEQLLYVWTTSLHRSQAVLRCVMHWPRSSDLERFEESFHFLRGGGEAPKTAYDVSQDIEAMELIERTFDRSFCSRAPGDTTTQPVFVLGLPRSGTTLVDRIISAHSQAESLGEINTLAFAVMRAVARSSAEPDGIQSKFDLIKRSAHADFAWLGARYAEGIAGYGHSAARLVDKTPLNFLYLGLIRLAMPNARIIHVRRHPVDSCYAMYKTLFRMGYPFTYSLQDVGRYYIAYHRLMRHWHDVAPGAFLDVDYEALVTDQENQNRRIIAWCGLDWEPAAEFHRSSTPAATASAAQVRQPMYTSSVGKWRA
jgi:tetratricopeptide (TPR) repeat protein